jgi:stearoyl-CoA desaturase (delta-9 desaturase)
MQSTTQTVPAVRRPRGLLAEPTYGWGEFAPRKPSLREIFVEWVDAINFFKDRTKLLTAMFTAFHLATFGVFVYFFATYFSVANVAIVMGLSIVIASIYNTVWYHRYCTHRAYKFRNLHWTKLFLWTNPVCFREESYVIPHHVHHSKEDRPGDPYGPHLGWLGSYLASESSAKTNLDMNRSDYERLAKGLKHIGVPQNSYEQFQRTGSVEKAWHWIARSIFVNLLWGSVAYHIADGRGLLTWYAAIFLYTFFVRDFNYRGHGGVFFKAAKGKAANQLFYGLIGGEWHENHHANPRLAHSGFEWWQIDVPYWIIKMMSWCGVVGHVNKLEGRARNRSVNSSIEAKVAH